MFLLFSPFFLYGLYFVSVLVFGTLTDYTPSEKIVLSEDKVTEKVANDSVFTFLNWNIGYGGLGNKADFFLDEGTSVRSDKADVERYLTGINQTLKANQSTDFILLQEVDKDSKRSYFTNEYQKIADMLLAHAAVFAENFNVKYVPVPLASVQPIGKVLSGLATYSAYSSTENIRYQYPGKYEWPKRIFHLDRCMLLKRVPLANGKELIVINSHNSAYDNGKLKPLEMEMMKKILLEEYNKGNYVVVGADWNQCPPKFAYDSFSKANADDYFQSNIAENFMPEGWQWVFDAQTPTNRKLAKPYKKGETFTTLIDFYLVSPNVEVLNVETIDLDFAFSDHQPIKLKVKLKN